MSGRLETLPSPSLGNLTQGRHAEGGHTDWSPVTALPLPLLHVLLDSLSSVREPGGEP